MKDALKKSSEAGLAKLAIDPDVLAKELAAELLGDPLDEIDLEGLDSDALEVAKECDSGLQWLQQGHEERLQGLRVFCEHRDQRALPLLLPLLNEPCPVERMSAVYALGRNPCPSAVDLLIHILQKDSNAYVRKATAWSLGNYSEAPVLGPLIKALKTDVAAVRLWAASSLAEAGGADPVKADLASNELLISLRVDSEAGVRSNCIWSLARLYGHLEQGRKDELLEVFLVVLLQDPEASVRDEARVALEQLDDPKVSSRVQTMIEEGLLG